MAGEKNMQRKNGSTPAVSVSVEAGDLRDLVRAVAAELKRQMERRAMPTVVESTDRTATKRQTTKQG
jgi:hypothetical protein